MAVILSSSMGTSVASTTSIDGVVFSVETDKKVYSYNEPVRIEVVCTNPSDELAITASSYTIRVADISTGQQLASPPAVIFRETRLSHHAKTTVLVAEIPPYALQSGNRKYRITVDYLYLRLKYNAAPETFYLAPDAWTIITVR